MATRPSGLRQPNSVRSSNTNLASASGATGGGSEAVAATPAKPTVPSSIPYSHSRLPSSSSIRRKITPAGGIQPPGSRDSGLANDIDSYIIGDIVYVNGDPAKRGKICFIGEVLFAKGDFAGIVLDLPMGNHDGMVQGKRYFQCSPNHGLFTKLSRLTRDPIIDSPSTPRAPQSITSSAVMSPDRQISRAASVAERTPSPAPSISLAFNSSLTIGERVIVASTTGGTKIGILRYLGNTDFATGDWAGVELLTPMGKNNGSVLGKSYFSCKEKHGLFVPVSKVISSPINKAPRRHGSRESLISVSSMASSAASRSIRRPSMRESQCLPSCSLQAVLSEKEKHVERLIKERELDRVDLANLSRQFEEKVLEVKKLQSDCSVYQQKMESSTGDSESVTRLQNALEEEHRKLEDLQYTLDEEKIMKTDLQTQLDALTAKLSDDSKKSLELSLAEMEERDKEIIVLKGQLSQREVDMKTAASNLTEAQLQIETLGKTIQELTLNVQTLTDNLNTVKEEREKGTAVKEDEITGLTKSLAEQTQSVAKLNEQLSTRKRREEEIKEKLQKIEVEYETTHKQKCTLESEVMDLVNSKSDTSELLSGKIKDLNEEVQELRAKLQSTEEDKAVVRRINAEFKSRVAKYEQSEAGLKKELEELQGKVSTEKAALEEQLKEQITKLQQDSEAEKQALQLNYEKQISAKEEETAMLRDQIAKLNENLTQEKTESETLSKEIQTMKSTSEQANNKVSEYEQLLQKAHDEKASLQIEAEQNQKNLNEKNSQLTDQITEISNQLQSSVNESSSLKKEIDTLKAELATTKLNLEENVTKAKSLVEEISNLKKQTESDSSALDELHLQIDSLKKDKSSLKEQIAAFKADSSRFQEVEKGLSQELLSLRSKLEQKGKAISDLEKELAEKKADIESSKVTKMDANSPQAHIEFLNSIIVDLQHKNEELNIKLNVLINGGVEADANSNRVAGVGSSTRTYQSLRAYCDICEKFDLHDTEDCPAQVSEENTHYGSNRGGESRPYCETCEIFGHVTGECDDQETY